MKKTLGTILCAATLICGAAQAEAALLQEWTYTLGEVTLDTGASTGSSVSWNSGNYSNTLDIVSPLNYTGNLFFEADNSGDAKYDDSVSITNTAAANHATDLAPATPGDSSFLASLTFNYTAQSKGGEVAFDIAYTIDLFTFSDGSNSYVYYATGDVGTKGETAATYQGYSYGISGVSLLVDGRDLIKIAGGENDPEIYSGWLINEDTRNHYYDEYRLGANNVDTGDKVGDAIGKFAIDGTFKISATELPEETTPTPEPATMLLMGLGLAGLGFVARRRSK